MKIKHLLEYQFPEIQRVNVAKNKHPGRPDPVALKFGDRSPAVLKRNDIERMGEPGQFATVMSNPKKTPHDVRKISFGAKRRRLDGFYYYMEALAEHPDNANPYFPRFRSIKVYTGLDPNGPDGDKVTYSAQMEKLYPIGVLSRQEVEALSSQILGKTNNEGDINIMNIILMINNAIIDASRGNVEWADKIRDEHLINAINFIGKVASANNTDIDLHDENIMVRRTSVGVQLVMTDPLGY